MGMYTAHVDPNDLMKRFGVDIDFWEQADLLMRAEKYPEPEVKEMLAWLGREFGRIEAKPVVMEAQVRMYLALRDLAKEREYDAVCVKCLPGASCCSHDVLPRHRASQRPLGSSRSKGVDGVRL